MRQQASQVESADERSNRAVAPKFFYYGWVIVAVCFVVLTLTSLVAASFPIFFVPILQDFNRSRGSTAIAMSLHLILSGLAAPFAGALIDRFGPRLVMPLGALVTGSALLWLSQSSAMWQFYASFGVIAAIGCSTLHITPMTTVASNWFVRHRGIAISIVVAGPGAGQLFLLPVLQTLIERVGWRNTYVVFGALILILPTLLILLFLYRQPSDRGLSSAGETRPNKKDLRMTDGSISKSNPATSEEVILNKHWAETAWTLGKAVRTSRFWALTLVMAMVAMGLFLVSVHLAAYLLDRGYSPMLAASVMGLQGLINVIGSIIGGILSDRLGREKTVTLGILTFIGCIVLLNIGGVVINTLIIYGFAILFGIGYGVFFPALMASVADLFQGKNFGSILGFIMLSGYFGGAVGAWIGGFFFDLTHAYRLNFLVAGAVMLTAAALIWKAGPGQIRVVRTIRAS
ncbi:MAG TPA: MFS transporter [Pyrinomonadaceae bacterium]|nr:MFS transporter [Pyrinomonadaceae bacterium]